MTDKAWALEVALRKESVDRNEITITDIDFRIMSLSARRAWIEIFYAQYRHLTEHVALRKESVDRNNRPDGQKYINRRSLSARRAWIEIVHRGPHHFYLGRSRSPQGERG